MIFYKTSQDHQFHITIVFHIKPMCNREQEQQLVGATFFALKNEIIWTMVLLELCVCNKVA